jgi:hypothetical protein
MIKELSIVAAQIEAVEGAKATLAAADGFLAFNPSFDPDIEMHERNPVRDNLSKYPSVSGKRSAKIGFDMELAGSGTPGTAPPWGKLMKACGFAETVSSGVSVTYKPASSSISSMTVALYQDGTIKRIWGARGTVKITWEAGKPPIARFDFTGADFEIVDGGLLSGVTYSPIIAPACLSSTFLVDSYAALISKVEFDMQNTLAKRIDMSSSSGIKSIAITGRNSKGTFDPEDVLIGTYDIFGKWKTPGTLGQMSFNATGAAGNIITTTMPKVRHKTVKPADRDGQNINNVEFEPTLSAGDDEISIVLT